MNTELVVIDSRLHDAEFLADQIAQGYTVLLLDQARDGLQQILDFMLQQAGAGGAGSFSALHLVSHGSAGEVQLGSTLLDAAALEQHQAALVELAKLLAPGADLMVYGCDVAQGADGQAFVTQLARLSGLDVAASTNLTGNAAAAGSLETADWVLETSIGHLETTALQLDLSETLAVNVAGAVTIGGTVTQGKVLTATNTLTDADGMGVVKYQWMAAGVNISGATAATFTLTQAQVGKAITVKASYTDLLGTAETKTSIATAAVANVNDLPTGSVTIAGTLAQGQLLTAANSLVDLDGMGTVSYQWLAAGTAITGATASTFTLTQAQVGKAITVKASYTDLLGAAESMTSAASVAVANVNDLPTGGVTIAGTLAQGQILTAANSLGDVDGMGTVSYQWLAGGTAIAGATASTFTLTQAQVGQAITVKASYTDLLGTAESVTSGASLAVANVNDAVTGSLSISGTLAQGQTLTATNALTDADGMGTVSYQWLAGGTAIAGATASTFTLTQAQVGKVIAVKASYTDLLGTAESMTSAATVAVASPNNAATGAVSISGTLTQGQMLTASNTLADADGMGTVSYQWLAGGVAITGATASTFTLTQAQVGKVIAVKASYTDLLGTAESMTSSASLAVANVNDAVTGSVSLSGTLTQGQLLTAVTNTLADADGMGTLSYQWLAGGTAIAGATASTFTLTQAQVGQAISVKVSYTDLLGTAESMTSGASAAVVNVNDAATGAVSISGSFAQGQLLTAANTLADADGLGTVSYQWLAGGVAIADATTSTFTLTQAQVGKAITVKASYTDGYGAAESMLSSASVAVANVNDAVAGTVSIGGTLTQGQQLTAANSLTDADGMGTVSYQWLAGGTAISGATASTLMLTQAQVGKAITVKASYTDGYGTAESMSSSASVAVANVNDAATGAVTIGGT